MCSEADERGGPGVRLSDSNTDNEAIDKIQRRVKLCFTVRKTLIVLFSLFLQPEGFTAEGSDWGARREGVLSF